MIWCALSLTMVCDCTSLIVPVHASDTTTPRRKKSNTSATNPKQSKSRKKKQPQSISAFRAPLPPRPDGVRIMGETVVSPQRMAEFVRERNPEFCDEIAEAFYRIGSLYGVRGDIALCQSVIETGWFKFGGGTAVTPDQFNYCGLGVTQRGVKGACFDSIEQGVTAQIQHLYAYACCHPLPEGETIIDPRFEMVSRGTAPSWEDLNLRWAMNELYGESILALYQALLSGDTLVQTVGIELPAEFDPDDESGFPELPDDDDGAEPNELPDADCL